MDKQSLINKINLKRQLLEKTTGELKILGDLNFKTERELEEIFLSLNNKLNQSGIDEYVKNANRLHGNDR